MSMLCWHEVRHSHSTALHIQPCLCLCWCCHCHTSYDINHCILIAQFSVFSTLAFSMQMFYSFKRMLLFFFVPYHSCLLFSSQSHEASDVLYNQHIFYVNSFTYFNCKLCWGILLSPKLEDFFVGIVLPAFVIIGGFVPCKFHLYLSTKERPLLAMYLASVFSIC